jgi:HTH-type transcriptional regulator / antitoxin HigA
MNITPINSNREYRQVLKEIEPLMNAGRNSPEGRRLDLLVTLVETWKAEHYRLDLPESR